MFTVKKNENGDVLAIHLQGILSSEHIEDLDQFANSLDFSSVKRIKFMLPELQLITSVGVRSLIQFFRESKKHDVDFWLVGARQQILDVLEVVVQSFP